MEKIKILYIHGLNSNGNSRTATTLRQLLGDIAIVFSPIFSSNVESFNVMKQNIRQAWSFVNANEINLIIGSSMGGFIASNLMSMPKILINPCLRPSEQFYKRTSITQEETDKYAEFENAMIIDREDRLATYGLFSTNDELFSYKNLFEKIYLPEHSYSMDDGHRISTDNIKNHLLPLIDTCMKNTAIYSKWYEQFEETMLGDEEFLSEE